MNLREVNNLSFRYRRYLEEELSKIIGLEVAVDSEVPNALAINKITKGEVSNVWLGEKVVNLKSAKIRLSLDFQENHIAH